MRSWILLLGIILCHAAQALEMPGLAQRKNCNSCHAIDKAMTGPAWRDVAKRYRGDREASVFLVNKVQHGGFGVWGARAMPRQDVTNEEARALVRFILGLPAADVPVALEDGKRYEKLTSR